MSKLKKKKPRRKSPFSLPAARDKRRTALAEIARQETLPPALLQLSQVVAVPAEVHPSRQARIVGCEFGNSYSRKNNHGCVYYLEFEGGGMAWEASEGELMKWQEVSCGS